MVPSLLRKDHEVGILKGDEKRFTACINPITMQIYSEVSLTSWIERSFENTEVDTLSFLGKVSKFIQPHFTEPDCAIISSRITIR